MTQRNQLRRPFRSLNPCDLRGRQHVALRDLISRNRGSGCAVDFYFPRRSCNAQTLWFCRNIHHLHLSAGTDVTKPLKRCIALLLPHAITPCWIPLPADRDHLAIRLIILPEIVLLRFPLDDVEEKLS